MFVIAYRYLLSLTVGLFYFCFSSFFTMSAVVLNFVRIPYPRVASYINSDLDLRRLLK